MSPAPLDLAALLRNGLAHHQAGRLPEAEAHYRRILEHNPAHVDALHLLGVVAMQVGRFDAATELITQAVALAPNNPDIQLNLGECHRRSGQPARAEAAFRRVLALAPNHAAALNNLGLALADLGRHAEALGCFERALAVAPDYADALNNLSGEWRKLGRLDEAIVGYTRAQTLQPGQAAIPGNLAATWWDAGCVEEALSCYRRARELDPSAAAVHSALVYTCLFHPAFDAAALLRLHREWNEAHAAPLRPTRAPHANERAPDRALRIGYVSPDFRDHVIARNVLPLLEHRDRARFELYCYADILKSDAFTERFRASADAFRDITGLRPEAVSELVRRDRIDILVDLSLHLSDNRLLVFARQPAPVQVTFAGYPGTTGVETIAYRLTDPYLDPPDEHDGDYTEKSVRLPDSFWCYVPGGDEPAVNALPAASGAAFTFGCLNYPGKISAPTLALWARVLQAVPASRLILLAPPGPGRDRLLRGLGAAGVPSERVEFVPRASRQEYLAHYHRIDLGLDSLPYNGHTTSLDSYWMGVPVVTLVGNTIAGRAGFSQLSNLGLTELVARTADEFVAIATRLAGDRARLASLRATLRERMARSPLTDAPGFTRGIEAAYRAMWRTWCRTAGNRVDLDAVPGLLQSGRLDEAEAIARAVLASEPDSGPAWHVLGIIALQRADPAAAVAAMERARPWLRDDANLHSNLGEAYGRLGRLEEAIACFRNALSLRPAHPDATNNLGNAMMAQGRYLDAVVVYEEAIRHRPGFAAAHFNLGRALRKLDRIDAAAAEFATAIALEPAMAAAHNELGGARLTQGRLDDAIASFQQAVALETENSELHSNLVLARLYRSGDDAMQIRTELRAWRERHGVALVRPHANDRSPERRLRIGYVSADLRDHPVARFLRPILAAHDRANFDVFVYSLSATVDAWTTRLRPAVEHWHDVALQPAEHTADLIRTDGIDILVDLGLHAGGKNLRVFAHKPAPVQVTYLAYPGDSGLATIDYRLTDRYLDPPGREPEPGIERPFRLPESYWCYEPTDEIDLSVAPLPATTTGFITFGCLNNFSKITPAMLTLWGRILQATPDAQLVLHAHEGEHRDRVRGMFAARGVDPRRLRFVGHLPRLDYFRCHAQIDIGLDPYPFPGGTTTVDALWMGVPVITLAGPTPLTRGGVSLLNNVGLAELVAESPEEYAHKAVALASDQSRLAEVRAGLRARLRKSPLMDVSARTRDIETAYRAMWRTWCSAPA